MIDTIAITSPNINEETAQTLEQSCIRRMSYQINSGQVLYELTTGQLEGSYDHRISFKIERQEWVAQEKGPPILVPCPPQIKLEGSLHKALIGHNISNGPINSNFRAGCQWLVSEIEKLLEIEKIQLAPADEWWLNRVDVAECFEIGSPEAVSDFFKGLNNSDYPRRQVSRYGNTGLYCAGTSTSVKIYAKGVEFLKRDAKRLHRNGYLKKEEILKLAEKASKIIRSEVEIKGEKLIKDFGHPPKVKEIKAEYLTAIYAKEMFRLLREGEIEMKIVRKAGAVEARLYEMYKPQLAGILMGLWYRLSIFGEEDVKKKIAKRSFYRQRKQLVDAGCDWHNTDVILLEKSRIPEGFSLKIGSPWHIQGEDAIITEKLAVINANLKIAVQKGENHDLSHRN